VKCCESKIIPRYADTDQMGIVHHAAYLPWFETGRDDFFKKMGYSYYQLEHNGHLMPVLNISCQYLKSAKYDEPVLLRSTLEKFKGARLSFRYELIREADLKLLSVAKIEYSITNRAYQPINIKKTNQELWEKLNNCFN